MTTATLAGSVGAGTPDPRRLVALGEPGRLLALDPGTERTAWIALDLVTRRPLGFGIEPNEELLGRLRRSQGAFDLVVIEKVESFGMAVGAEVFETVFWSGRFAEAVDPVPVERIGRKAVKLALCGDPRAKDPNVRQALIDRAARTSESGAHCSSVCARRTGGAACGGAGARATARRTLSSAPAPMG